LTPKYFAQIRIFAAAHTPRNVHARTS